MGHFTSSLVFGYKNILYTIKKIKRISTVDLPHPWSPSFRTASQSNSPWMKPSSTEQAKTAHWGTSCRWKLGERDKDQKLLARFFFVVTMVTSRGTKNECALETSNMNTKSINSHCYFQPGNKQAITAIISWHVGLRGSSCFTAWMTSSQEASFLWDRKYKSIITPAFLTSSRVSPQLGFVFTAFCVTRR